MQSDATDRFYNVGTGTKTSVKELAEMLLDLTGSDLPVEYQPEGLTFVKNRIGSPELARREIGFSATTRLRDGLAQLIRWRRNHMNTVTRQRRKANFRERPD